MFLNAFIALLIVGVLVTGAALYVLFLKHNRSSLPAGSQVNFTVPQGAGSIRIAQDLKKAGLIDSTMIFRFRLARAGAGRDLKAGTHLISAGSDYGRIILELQQSPNVVAVKVTIPEGKNIKQIGALLEEKLGLPATEFIAYAEQGAPGFAETWPWLTGAYNDSLEGYLFPDTYQFTKNISAREVCATMLDRFNQVWSTLNVPSDTGYSTAQLVTIASLVEKEVAVSKERPLVASVIYNRLKRNMKLQLCSSVQFLLPDPEKNKLRLTNDDLKIASPYNTYLNAGLPPGPVANPGKAALQAALSPAETNYVFFVLTGTDGSQTFAATEADFAAAKAKSKKVFGQ